MSGTGRDEPGAGRGAPGLTAALAARLVRLGRGVGLGRVLAAALLALLVLLRIWDPPPVESLRVRTFDAFQTLKPREPIPERPVVIVDIDEASLAALGQWPWPRTRVAELCRRLAAAGALVVALDLVFSEPDRLSPPLLADTLPDLSEAARAELKALPSNDALFAAAIAEGRVVLGQTATDRPVPWTGGEPPPRTGVAVIGATDAPMGALLRFPGLVRNVPALEGAAAGRGVFTINPERDGIVRRVPMVMRAGGDVVPTLSLEIIRVLTGASSLLVRTDEGGIAEVRLPELALPTDSRGQLWVRFAPHDPDLYLSARDVLAGTVPAERLRDKIVLVGTSAVGLLDNRTTPIDRAMPGVEVHAQLLETMLTGTALVAAHDAILLELALALAVALAIIVLAPILGAIPLLILGGTVAALLAYASWHLFSRSGILLDATFPLAASLLVYLTLLFTNYLREQLGRARIRSAFGQYLSPALVEQLANSPEALRLGGEERRLTVMFSDVRGFTAIAEFYKPDPQGLTQLMNRFLTPLTNAILARRGTIDKYMGDAIMAFWNAPLTDADQELNAAQAALDMLARMDALNAQRRAEAKAGDHPVLPLEVGIGINTGPCVVGNMGSDLRFDYSALGDTVNVASRLEGQTKLYGVKVILGQATADAVRDRCALIEIDLVQVKGKSEPERISALLGGADVRETPGFAALAERHGRLLAEYRARRWERAACLARECRGLADGYRIDGLYGLYEHRAKAFADHPPPEDWAGVYVAETK